MFECLQKCMGIYGGIIVSERAARILDKIGNKPNMGREEDLDNDGMQRSVCRGYQEMMHDET